MFKTNFGVDPLLAAMITSMIDHTKNSKCSPDHKCFLKAQYTTTVVPANKRSLSFEGAYYKQNFGMYILKHEIISPKLYEILVKTELKLNTAMNLKNFYNHINMSLHAVTGLQ